MQRILALTAAIWHNDPTDRPALRSLRSGLSSAAISNAAAVSGPTP